MGDSLLEIASFGDFKQALRTAREALSYVYPWNKSIAALEGFLIRTQRMQRSFIKNVKECSILFIKNAKERENVSFF